MNNTALADLVEWIFVNKEIFNSSQYLDIMDLAQKLVVPEVTEEDNYQIILQLNNYRLPESDSEMEEEEEEEEAIDDNKNLGLITSDAEGSENEEDLPTYTGSYIDSY